MCRTMLKVQEEQVKSGMLPQPSVEDFARLLHVCRNIHDRVLQSRLCSCMLKSGLDAHVSLGNYLIVVLVEAGNIHEAQLVFEKLQYRYIWSWDALISGCNNCEKPQDALTLYEKIREGDSLHPTGRTYVELLKACKKLKDFKRGFDVHAEIAKTDLFGTDLFVGSTLLDMYAKCGLLAEAQEVFDELPVRDVVAWTALIGGYAEHELGEEALDCFDRMQQEGLSPNAVTFVLSLKACGSIGSIDRGKQIHLDLEKKGLLGSGNFVGSALVDMYARCGSLTEAKEVLDRLPARNVVLWNALIAGYTEHGLGEDALKCFEQMCMEGILPDTVTFVCSLKACGSVGLTDKGQEIHAEIERKGFLESDHNIGNTLVDMYSKCGMLDLAREVFDMLSFKDVVSWTALIVGYSEHGHGKEAIKHFEQMQLEGVSPNSITIICCLKACGSTGATDKGEEIHAMLDRHKLLERDVVVGNSLIAMYAKCGLLVKAQQVLNKLLGRNIVSWNALLSGYCEHGQSKKALDCFKQMQFEGVSPTPITFVCSLKACGDLRCKEKGIKVHIEIEKRGLSEGDLVVGNAVVDMYAKCGLLSVAHQVFDKLPVRDAVTWTALISGYSEHGHCQQAVQCVKQMQLEGHFLDAVTLVCVLKACANIKDIDMGGEMHVEIERQGLLERELLVGSTLVYMYLKCGSIAKAQQVFDKVPIRNEVTWNALIAGHAEHGHGEEALQYLEQMQLEGVSPDALTITGSLIACTSIGAVDKGQELHAEAERRGVLEKDYFIGDILVDMYAKCGSLVMAQEVFDKLTSKNAATWTTLMVGYVERGFGEVALKCFEQMQYEGVVPDNLAFVWSLKACCILGAMEKGEEIHAEIERKGLLEKDLIGNALVDMYAKCGLHAKAQNVFDKLPFRNVVSWNALIMGYAKYGHGEETVMCLEQMQLDGVGPDAVTMLCSLKACGIIGATSKGQIIHTDIERHGLLETNFFIGNTLVDMYARCGSLAKAQQIFDKLHFRDAVTWNTLMLAYVKHGLGEEALKCVYRMHLEGISPSGVTFICSLKACGSTGAWDTASYIHAEIERLGLLETDLLVGNTLVDMYAKWGFLAKAQEVFKKLPSQGVVSWTALMAGYAQLGESESVISTYDRMLGEGIRPDSVTFVVVLNACSRTGLHTKSQTFFDAMSQQYGIAPSLEHHSCVISLFTHSGQLERALSTLMKIPVCPNVRMWRTVLGGCVKSGNVKLGKLAFGHAVHLDKKVSVPYVSMSQIYAGVEV